jgi:hypothetical protein
MALNLLTSRDAVLAAVREFDELGRDAFLAKYGYDRALSYFVERPRELRGRRPRVLRDRREPLHVAELRVGAQPRR